jgi:hypothetical protein
MKFKHVILSVLCMVTPILMGIRVKLIYSEGPRIINGLQAYKQDTGSYPDT